MSAIVDTINTVDTVETVETINPIVTEVTTEESMTTVPSKSSIKNAKAKAKKAALKHEMDDKDEDVEDEAPDDATSTKAVGGQTWCNFCKVNCDHYTKICPTLAKVECLYCHEFGHTTGFCAKGRAQRQYDQQYEQQNDDEEEREYQEFRAQKAQKAREAQFVEPTAPGSWAAKAKVAVTKAATKVKSTTDPNADKIAEFGENWAFLCDKKYCDVKSKEKSLAERTRILDVMKAYDADHALPETLATKISRLRAELAEAEAEAKKVIKAAADIKTIMDGH